MAVSVKTILGRKRGGDYNIRATISGDTQRLEITDAEREIKIDPLTVTENGEYIAESGHAFNPVTVNVETGTPPCFDFDFETQTFLVRQTYVYASTALTESGCTYTVDGYNVYGWYVEEVTIGDNILDKIKVYYNKNPKDYKTYFHGPCGDPKVGWKPEDLRTFKKYIFGYSNFNGITVAYSEQEAWPHVAAINKDGIVIAVLRHEDLATYSSINPVWFIGIGEPYSRNNTRAGLSLTFTR